MISATFDVETRICPMSSRNRMVTSSFFVESPSMVIPNGVPAASCRR